MTPYYSLYHFPYSPQAPAILSLQWFNGYVVKSNVNCSQLVFIFEVCWFYFKAKESLKAHLLSLITLVIFMEDYLCLQTLPNQFEWLRTLPFRSFSNNTQNLSASDSSLRCRWVLSTATVQTRGLQNRHGKWIRLWSPMESLLLTPWSENSSPFLQVCSLPCMPLPNQSNGLHCPAHSPLTQADF